jgi:death on curing protein
MSGDIVFLSIEQVVELHEDLIRLYGGLGGVRDAGLLESAIAMPQAAFGGEYLHQTVAEMAAAYLFHLCLNHPFHDGNKRIAFATAGIFLGLNGFVIDAAPEEEYDITIAVASGSCSKEQLTKFLAEHIQKHD